MEKLSERFHQYFLLLMSLVCWQIGALGQQVTLSGKVLDDTDGSPLVGAAVFVPQLKAGTYTDSGGNYSFDIEPEGISRFEVQISYQGYAKQTFSYSAPFAEIIENNIELRSEALTAEAVVITATKGLEQKQSDVTVSIEVVKPASIDLQAASDINKVLDQIPGVDNKDGQIDIRGSSGYAFGVGSRVMVMMDGLPMINGSSGTAQLSLLPVDDIAQVEVLKGASSVLYGSGALGGVINVITADPTDEPLTSVRLRGAIFDQPRNKGLDWDGDASPYQASAHIFHRQKFKDVNFALQTNLIKDSGYREGTDTESFRSMLRLSYSPTKVPGLTVGFNASALVDSGGAILFWPNYRPDTVNNQPVGGALSAPREGNTLRKELSQKYAVDPYVKFLSSNGNLFWYRGRYLYTTNANDTDQSNNSQIFYNDFIFQTALMEKINWVSGITYILSTADGGIYEGNRKGDQSAAYTQFDGKFGRLNTSLGVRFESVKFDDRDRENQFILRAGLNYNLWRGGNMRASFGQAYRAPTVAERFTRTSGGSLQIEPNPTIQSETGFSGEIGFRQGYELNTGFEGRLGGYIDIAGFRMQYEDMIEFGFTGLDSMLRPVFSTRNVADAQITGIEITTQNFMEINDWTLGLGGGITLINPKNLNAVPIEQQLNLEDIDTNPIRVFDIFDPDLSDQPELLKYRNKFTARFTGTVAYGPVGITANYRRRSNLESIDQYLYLAVGDLAYFRQTHPDGYHELDLIVSTDIGEKNKISLIVDNVWNEEFAIIPGILGEQRKFTVQYQLKF